MRHRGTNLGKKVDTWIFRDLGIEIAVHLDSRMQFGVVWEDTIHQDKDGPALRKLVEKMVRESVLVEWQDVICVDVGKPGHGYDSTSPEHEGLTIQLSRFRLARKANGALIKSHWNYPKDQWLSNAQLVHWNATQDGEFILPVRCGHDTKWQGGARVNIGPPTTFYFTYTEEMWNNLLRVNELLKNLRGQLYAILGSPEVEKLLAIGHPAPLLMLPLSAPDEDEPK